jgi:N-acetylmuramoyl-L-alanine amidase
MQRLATYLFVLFLAILGAGNAPAFATGAVEVTSIRYAVSAPRTRVVVDASGPITANAFFLVVPNRRLVVDLPRVHFAMDATSIGSGQQSVTGNGEIEKVRFAQFSQTTSRLVFDLAAPLCLSEAFTVPPGGDVASHRLILDLEQCDEKRFAAAASARKVASAAREFVEKSGRGQITVVIDPGHGGKDPGATAKNGLREKDVNLAVAKLLAEELARDKKYRVVMTREDDRFIELADRVHFAREENADLFISIHADSVKGSTKVRGASIYTLAERARPRAKAHMISDGNFLYDLDLDSQPKEVGAILFDMAQRDTGNRSSAFASIVLRQMSKVTPMLRNSHRDAGFMVLLAPDVPATLIELGFLSNPQDAELLKSTSHRKKLARSMAKAIDEYFAQDQNAAGFRTARLAMNGEG